MEVSQTDNEWYVTHEGQKFGPVSIDDLRFEAERGELNPCVDMVWKEGMEDWISSSQIEGLFEKKPTAEPKEKAKETIVASEFRPQESKRKRILRHEKWRGVKRGNFIFLCYLFPFLWSFGIILLAGKMQGKIEADLLAKVTNLAAFLPVVILCLIMIPRRFQNLGMSMAWCFGLIVPLLQMWLGYRLFACPEGYAVHKKLDRSGWLLAFLYWVPVVLLLAFIIFAASTLTQPTEGDPFRETIGNYLRRAKEFLPGK